MRASLDASDSRNKARPLRDPRAARRRRHGGGLPGARSELKRDVAIKVLPTTSARTNRSAAALRAGGPGGRGAEPSQHHGGLRPRLPRRRAVHRHGASRGRDASGAARRRRASRAQGDRLRHPDRQGSRRGAREGDRAPRPEARERLRHERRPRQDPRLRPGEADAGGWGDGAADEPSDGRGHRARRGHGDARLHVAGAGEGQARRCSVGHLLLRRDPLRDALRLARVPPGYGGGNDVGDPARGSAGPLGNEQERPAGARAGRAPLPREEPGGTIPLGARSRVRSRVALGNVVVRDHARGRPRPRASVRFPCLPARSPRRSFWVAATSWASRRGFRNRRRSSS